MPSHTRPEAHLIHRVGWLRAAVMGANDGIVSTASLIVGVAAASPDRAQILVAGLAGLAAGAMSMAAGEYVSVSSQSDTERSDIARERAELTLDPAGELTELTQIYVDRGLDPALASQVAAQLTQHDALGSHLRDELGLSEAITAAPVQAAVVSAATFAAGAALPLGAAALAPAGAISVWVTVVTLLTLAGLGAVGAQAGGAGIARGTLRVLVWGAMAMAATAAVGHLFGVVTG
ncbi:MAG: VIT1/CCC1 transporter family protein [Paracoccus hibiscisoli]|uniref:VIT1/CCC1 transporter family protein n=1 Tax=Paracoccus hibiscisoli TaxID=2023261 RepID=UPI00391BAE22